MDRDVQTHRYNDIAQTSEQVREIPQAWSELESWLSDCEQVAIRLMERLDCVLDGSHQLDEKQPVDVATSRTRVAERIHDQTRTAMRITGILQRLDQALAL